MSDSFYVIKILDKKSVLIDYGRKHGAKKNDTVRVIVRGPEVLDLDGNVLGTFDAVKTELTLVTVYDQFSLCRKIRTYTRNALVSPLTAFTTTTSEEIELNVDNSEISDISVAFENTIRVGDLIEILD